jgi:ubiquinone/menaquinone biosynthesis C-methylase UbiE
VKIKADWSKQLHAIRRKEIERIFAQCPPHTFAQGLELGAGDGFQSTLLTAYVSNLISTDFNPERLKRADTDSIKYLICDAEQIDAYFVSCQFDLVFSSSLLEHLPQVDRALAGIHRILKDDGVTIHVMPSQFWKLGHVLLHNPNRFVTKLERSASRGNVETLPRTVDTDNNPKSPKVTARSKWWPVPHGAYSGNLEEFRAFSRSRWRAVFAAAGFEVAHIMKGPVASGYGFGLDWARHGLERLGVASEYVYIATKARHRSPFLHFFTQDASPRQSQVRDST